MANLHITELSGLSQSSIGGGIAAISGDAVTAVQVVAIGVLATSAAFQIGAPGPGVNGNAGAATPPTRYIAITAGANCSIAIGAAPVAVTGGFYISSQQAPLILAVTPGEKIACIADTP